MANSNTLQRTNETLLPRNDPYVQAVGNQDRVNINPSIGGVGGYDHDVFTYLNIQPHIPSQGWCILLNTPNLFSRLPGGNRLHSMTKAFFENRSLKWEGLSDRTENAFAEVQWTGHRLSFPSGATRTLGNVTHSTYDIDGEHFRWLFKIWGDWALSNPDTQYANAVALNDPGDLLLDDISCSAIYFDTTRNGKAISSAQLVVGMMPRTKVPFEIRRNKEDQGQLRQIDMEFTGLVESDTLAVKQIAQKFLSRITFFNPGARSAPQAFLQRSQILESITEVGFIEEMKKEASKILVPNYIL